MKKTKHYLVDSENVNDNWLMLLELADPEDEIIVFYTKNSPHMSYASVVKLLERTRPVRFEECYSGNNGLDFQLVSYLGYLLNERANAEDEFIIMSNDTGFDSAVSFWKDRHFAVARQNVNSCKQLVQGQKASNTLVVQNDEVKTIVEIEPVAAKPNPYDFDKEEVDTFINCIGKKNLTAIHETLVHAYGQPQGQKIYKVIKEKSYPLEVKTYKRKDKVKHFSDIVFTIGDIKNPGNFVEFLENNKEKTKNLNSIRAAILKRYGNEAGMKYYSLFKPYFKIISSLT